MVSQLSLFPELPRGPLEPDPGAFEELPDSFFDDDHTEEKPREPRVDPQTGFLE